MKHFYKIVLLSTFFIGTCSLGALAQSKEGQAQTDGGDPRSPENATFSLLVSTKSLNTAADFENYKAHVAQISGVKSVQYCVNTKEVFVVLNRGQFIATLPTEKFPENWVSNPMEFPFEEMRDYVLDNLNIATAVFTDLAGYRIADENSDCFNKK